MEIFGIGTSELLFILILALIILGPRDMQKAGKTIGTWMRKMITSDGWKIFQQTSRELRTLPNRLMREANEELGEVGVELKKTADLLGDKNLHSMSPGSNRVQQAPPASKPMEPMPVNNIQPPVAEQSPMNESDTKPDA